MGVKKTKQRRTCTYQQYIEFSKSRFLATHHPDIYEVFKSDCLLYIFTEKNYLLGCVVE